MKLYQRFNKDGRLLSPYWWASFGSNGRVHRVSTKQRTYAKAETVAHQIMSEVGTNPNALKRSPRLDEELKTFETWIQGNQELRPKSKQFYLYGCKMLHNTKLRSMPLDRINRDVVAATAFPAGPSNANVAIRTLRRLLTRAHEAGRLPSPPKLRMRKENKRSLVLTDEIEAKMLPLLPETTGFVLMCIRDTGMRPGEVFAMRWEFLDWSGRQYRNPGGKTPAAQRKVLLSERIMGLLHERHLVQNTPASGWVLPSPRTKSGHVEKICEAAFRRARKQLGLPANLVLYCCRHDYATNAMIATGNISVVGKLLGHSTIAMTARYSHPPDSESERIRALIDSRLCTNGVHEVVPIDVKTRKQSVN
jgi:integrase